MSSELGSLHRTHPISLLLVTATVIMSSNACTPRTESIEYPTTRKVDVVDDYHGTEIADPYRWLEDLDSEQTASWVAAQNALSEPRLLAVDERAEIEERLTELWNHERFGRPFKEGGLYFYFRNDGLQNQDVLYVTESLDGDARVLIDPNGLRDDGTVSLAGLSVSPDGKHIAYGTSDGGSDWNTWQVREVATGKDTKDTIKDTKFSGASWTGDGQGFYYSRYPRGQDGRADDQKAVALYYHRLGEDQSEDRLVYEIPEHPLRNPYGSVTDDGQYLILSIQEGYLTSAVYYRDLRQNETPVVKLLDDWDALYNFIGNDGPVFYFQTNLDAPRNRVLAIDLRKPERDNWREVIAQQEAVLDSTSMVGGRLIARYLEDVKSVVRLYAPNGEELGMVELPGIGSVGGFNGKWNQTETFYTFTSITTPPTIYRYDIAQGQSTLFRREEVDIEPSAYETVQVFYPSKDGTEIPMFIAYKKGIELDGQNPTLLYGYGGFDISLTPSFSLARAVWLERGGVLAIANLRGGGEYGKDWHLAGTKLEKQNVFDDFIAAAEYLIDNRYTSTPKLAIQGGSNGGLLVGAALTQRPDLFGAALPAVGVLDMLRYHLASANARNWSTDYGLSENEEEFRAQLEYSPLHNVVDGTCYPPTLITTADHDDRVVPWHSFKFGARMQAAQGCDNPILLKIETRAGHGAGTPTSKRIESIADQWAFLVDHIG